ncbi:hypothetical protein S40285_10168 [Stachybotrys chlorohalonatus IBT 40285]|uniref:Uncharacterized protein n=1 Tax=Stachybotrys chlorohalonatus (strain IBT 40285) TaxID=1283841 RepID=A0A084R0C5_STAC4|nr:hypothetical protein S40285_10168 [Stachybotrys chlorohalonata IBT 40285]
MANHLHKVHALHAVAPSSFTSGDHKDSLLTIDHLIIGDGWAAARFLHESLIVRFHPPVSEADVRCSRVGRVAERLQELAWDPLPAA